MRRIFARFWMGVSCKFDLSFLRDCPFEKPMAKRSGRPKPKSIKSKAINKNSKRKLDTLGKKLKKGYAGEAILYMTRSQALRKLSLSLKDFRYWLNLVGNC